MYEHYDPNEIIDLYQQKLAELVEDLPFDEEVQEKFAGDMFGGLVAGRACVEQMDTLAGYPMAAAAQDEVQAITQAALRYY